MDKIQSAPLKTIQANTPITFHLDENTQIPHTLYQRGCEKIRILASLLIFFTDFKI